MKKQPIGFRGNKVLIDLINIMAAQMGMKKSDFIKFGVEMVAKTYNESLYNEYKNGDIKILGDGNEQNRS